MAAQYWICPSCGALITPFHSHCHNCGKKISLATKCLMLASLGYVAASTVKYARLAPSGAPNHTTAPVAVGNSTTRQVKGDLYRAKLAPCRHYAWVRGEEPRALVGKTVRCPKCPSENNLRKVSDIQA